MLSKTLKRFGNSRCLPLDKTLLAILGVEYDNTQVTISIDENKLIIQKMPIYEEKTQFSLNAEQWEKFNKILDEKPDVTALKELLNSKGLLDE
ncbi:MAG: hypothetical protein WCG95_02685 [bacterium]